jgi:hypothetical protein
MMPTPKRDNKTPVTKADILADPACERGSKLMEFTEFIEDVDEVVKYSISDGHTLTCGYQLTTKLGNVIDCRLAIAMS